MLLILLALACTKGTDDTGDILDDSGGGDGGTAGDAGAPFGCEEVGREDVADPSVAAEGVDFAAAEVLTAAIGDFRGTATLRGATGELPAVGATLQLAAPSRVQVVYRELSGGGGTDTGPSPGAPSPTECPPWYEATSAAGLATDDSALAEAFTATLFIPDPASASFGVAFDLLALGGSYSPADFDPTAYDQTTLSITAVINPAKAAWVGALQWSASRELGTGMGEGVVGPAGSFEVAAKR